MKRFLLLPLFLLSCSKSNHWAFDQVHSDQMEFRSTKLTYRAPDPINGINVELVKTHEHQKIYLNIQSIPIAPYHGDPKKALLTMEIEGKQVRCEIRRLEGGQRFLLPDEIAENLIVALRSHHKVILTLPGYRTCLNPEGFTPQFESYEHPFLFQNPFQLPI